MRHSLFAAIAAAAIAALPSFADDAAFDLSGAAAELLSPLAGGGPLRLRKLDDGFYALEGASTGERVASILLEGHELAPVDGGRAIEAASAEAWRVADDLALSARGLAVEDRGDRLSLAAAKASWRPAVAALATEAEAGNLSLDYRRDSGRLRLSAEELAGLAFPADEPAAALKWLAGPSGIIVEAGDRLNSVALALGDARISLTDGLAAELRSATLSWEDGGSLRLAIEGLAFTRPLLDLLLPAPGLAPPPMRIEATVSSAGAEGTRLDRLILEAGAARIEAEGRLPSGEGRSGLAIAVRAVGLAELLAAAGATHPEALLAASGIPASGEARFSLTSGPDGLLARPLPEAEPR